MHTDRIEQALQGLRPAAANATREFSYMTAAVLIALACVAVLLAILVPNAMFAGEARAHETENGAARFEPKPRLAEQHRREVLEQRRERGEDATNQKGAANEKAAAKK